MAKIVVMKDDNSDSDFTDLYDLVFQGDATKRTLEYIDVENLQGLLLLKGTDVFTKSVLTRVLDYFESIYLSQAFQLISNHLLEHFTKDQLEQFVETIVSKNNTTTMNKTRTVNPRCVDFGLSSFLDEGWTREEVVLRREGDGMTTIHAERIVPICYWENFIQSALTPNYDGDFVSREDVHCIFNCLKYVGDASAKKLFLHEDDNGFIMIQSSQTIVKLMLNHLTKESQEEVIQQWRKNAPLMSSFFTTSAFTKPTSIRFARYCSDILRFYLNYGSETHLNEFIDVATSPRNIGDVEFSVWSCAFEKLGKDETTEMLTLVVDKVDIIGRDDVKKLLLHEIDQVPFIIKSFSRGEDVDGWLDILPKEMKREIQQFIEQKAPEFLGKASSDFETFFKTLNWRQPYNKLNTFTFFLNYQNDKSQLEQLMQKIMSPINEENTRSVWAELLTQECEDHKTDDIEKMDKFMKIVSDKLGSNFVKELVLHNDGEKPVIFHPVLRGEEKLLETMLNYLFSKDRKKIQRQVDEYLDETFKIPPDDNWINRFPFSLF
jgi:hypothetical protein